MSSMNPSQATASEKGAAPGKENNDQFSWRKSHIPYIENGHALQTTDVWTCKVAPDDFSNHISTTEPNHRALWIIYIHGGAWRDPLVDSSSFTETVRQLSTSGSALHGKIAGLASINYSLSPHPMHPDHPAPVPGPGIESIPSQSAKHPDHVIDVLNALAYLDSRYQFGNNYILVGHSCGATLAFQVAMNQSQWLRTSSTTASTTKAPKPIAIVGLNGLYDLPSLISDPGNKHQHLAALYEGFTRLAFGDDHEEWLAVSPVSVRSWSDVWPEGKLAVLVQSHEDTLVPYSQTDLMFQNLRQSPGKSLQIKEMNADGDHNDLWKKGDQLAQILGTVLHDLS